MKINYQKILEETINKYAGFEEKPSLLLHSCCAPCSSYVLEYLNLHFNITILYYNPNIFPEEEYLKRLNELDTFIDSYNFMQDIEIIRPHYDANEFFKIAKSNENDSEGGERCFKCYELRLRKTAEYANANNFDYFTTTLSISPYKNAQKLNTIGENIAKEIGVEYLYSDFKKNNGYKRSIELSKEYNLYRQNYCGCIYSKAQAENRDNERNTNANI